MVQVHERTIDERWYQRRCRAIPADPRVPSGQPPRLLTTDDRRPIGPALAWERLQEQAIAAFLRGDGEVPARNWLRALEIAEGFAPNDPRLAASLTNHAYRVQQTRGQQLALRWFEQALGVWDDGWRWVRRMEPPVGEAPYDEAARARFMALLRQGRAATQAIARFEPVEPDRMARFRELRPHRMTNLRALLGAVLLIVPARGRTD
jgi:hypothetical protein